MKLIIKFIFLITLLVSCNKYTVPTLISEPPQEYTQYPNWFVQQQFFKQIAKDGTHYKWLLSFKDSNKKDRYPDSAIFVLPTEPNKSYTVEVETNKGVPIIMFCDNFIHSSDAYSTLNEYEGSKEMPFNPLKFEIGSNRKATLCFQSGNKRIVKVWIWLLDGEFDWPEPFESSYSDIDELDTIFGDISDEEIFQLNLMDSLWHVDIFNRAWNNETTNSKFFTKAKVDINVKTMACSDAIVTDYYEQLLRGVDSLNTFYTGGKNSLKELKSWYPVKYKLDSLRSVAFDESRTLHQKGIQFVDGPINISLENKLKILANHPSFLAELVKRDRIYSRFPTDEDAKDLFRMFFVSKKGEHGMLKSNLSDILAQGISKIPGTNVAIYDSRGYIVAANQPFTFLNITSATNWDKVVTQTATYSSDCYTLPAYGFDVKKVFVPIKSNEEDKIIGWLISEIYCR